MRQVIVLLFCVAACTAAANAQCGDPSVLGWTLAGPCAERYARQAYTPVPPVNYNGYYPTSAVANGGRAYYTAAPKPQKPPKPLDCRKSRGKRGKNEAACAAAEAETIARQEAAVQRQITIRQAAEQRAHQNRLAASPWRLYNRSGFTVEVYDGNRGMGRMRPGQSQQVLEPTTGFRAVLLQPDFSGGLTRAEARIRPANDFQGWVITAPRVEE